MTQEQQGSTKVTAGEAVGLIYLISSSHVVALSPIIRNGQGSELFDFRVLVAMVSMLVLTGGQWLSGMGIYLAVWFVALACRRIETFNRWRQGVVTHSLYIGDPWLAMKFVSDPRLATYFEPFMCLLIGAALYLVSATVGLFVMAGFLSIGVCMGIDRYALFRRLQIMHDAEIEGKYYGEEFRRGR
jgi:hypothetical protein